MKHGRSRKITATPKETMARRKGNERGKARKEPWREAIKRQSWIIMGQYEENLERLTAVQRWRNRRQGAID
jgi:hypothetical protein